MEPEIGKSGLCGDLRDVSIDLARRIVGEFRPSGWVTKELEIAELIRSRFEWWLEKRGVGE